MGLKADAAGRPYQLLYVLILLAEFSLAIALLAVVGDQLYTYTWYGYNVGFYGGVYTTVYGACFMQDSYTNSFHSVCGYAYWVGSVSVVISFGVLVAQLVNGCTGNFRRSCLTCLPILSAFLWIWWIVGASIFTSYVHDADSAHIPQSYWRHVVVGLAWGMVLLYTLHLLIDIAAAVSTPRRDAYPAPANYPTGTAAYNVQPDPKMAAQYPPPQYPVPSGGPPTSTGGPPASTNV